MRQKTDILEEVPIYHKTRSAMYLFLTPHQREVQRTFGFWIDDEKNPCYVDFFSLSASHLNPNLVRCRLPFWVHLEMRQKTDILEEVPIYHKTRSAMHLFLHLHKVQRTSAGFFIGLILQNGGDPIPKCIAPGIIDGRAWTTPLRATSY
jgi:hypothetical protein